MKPKHNKSVVTTNINVKVCARLGDNWSTKWSATAVGRSGREGDKICRMVADKLNITEFPSKVFPQGIMVLSVI